MVPPLYNVGILVIGVLLFFIAPKIVGFVIKVIGFALVIVGAAIYKFPNFMIPAIPPDSRWVLVTAALPAIAGLGMLVVGQNLAKLAVRVAGILLIISALSGLGVISL